MRLGKRLNTKTGTCNRYCQRPLSAASVHILTSERSNPIKTISVLAQQEKAGNYGRGIKS